MSGANYIYCSGCNMKAYYVGDRDTSGLTIFHDACYESLIEKMRADALRDAIEVVRGFMDTESGDERCDDSYCDLCIAKPLIITAIEALGEQ